MTVCVAALASDGGVIICVADKALSYGEGLAWDSDSTKIVPLGGSSALALTAGSEGYISRFLKKVMHYDGYQGDIVSVIGFLERQYKKCFEEMQDIEVLVPSGISRPEYVSALSASSGESSVIRTIHDQMMQFKQGFDCELLICGFSGGMQPYILCVGPPGKVVDYSGIGFHAIGEGAANAIGPLLFVEHKRKDGVAHVLFDCFDAKANAEMAPHVGYEWDGYLITGAGAKSLVAEAKPLIDRVWAKRNRSPFKKKKEADDLPEPPRDWEGKLRMMVAKSLGRAFVEGETRTFERDDN